MATSSPLTEICTYTDCGNKMQLWFVPRFVQSPQAAAFIHFIINVRNLPEVEDATASQGKGRLTEEAGSGWILYIVKTIVEI